MDTAPVQLHPVNANLASMEPRPFSHGYLPYLIVKVLHQPCFIGVMTFQTWIHGNGNRKRRKLLGALM